MNRQRSQFKSSGDTSCQGKWGREFGLLVVAGTMEGTRKIKTGDKIKVDGDTAAYIF